MVAQRLRDAGLHQHEAVSVLRDRANDFFLFTAEGRQAEYGIEDGERVGGGARLDVTGWDHAGTGIRVSFSLSLLRLGLRRPQSEGAAAGQQEG